MLQCTRLPESHKESCLERIFNWLSNSVAFAFDLEAEINSIRSFSGVLALTAPTTSLFSDCWHSPGKPKSPGRDIVVQEPSHQRRKQLRS